MKGLYSIGIWFYWLTAWILSPWNPKARKWVRGRRNWESGLRQALVPGRKVIWFHCASLGEFEQGRPVMEEVRRRFPGRFILLTFFSPSGYEKQKAFEGADHVMYLPLDTGRNARILVDAMDLEWAMFIKYEFWYHHLERLRRKGVPVYLASGHFRPDQAFFKWYGVWYRTFLECFTHIFVQDEASAGLLHGIGINRVSVAGDTRFDRVKEVASTDFKDPLLEAFCGERVVVVAGSTWDRDEELLEDVKKQTGDRIRWVIAPHELSPAHLERLCKRFPGSVLYTKLKGALSDQTQVLIMDTIGMLSYLYRFAKVAYVGGGFGKGIHNILEAAIYGVPVIFGPAHRKFKEARDLVGLGGAFPVTDSASLLFTINQQLDIHSLFKTSSETARNYVLSRVGATSYILDRVCKKEHSAS